MTEQAFDDWAILEILGHRRLGGRVSEQLIAGAPFVRIDVPAIGEEKPATQFYSPGAVYCITPCAEDLARRVAEGSRVRPVERWELPAALTTARPAPGGGGDDDFEPDPRD